MYRPTSWCFSYYVYLHRMIGKRFGDAGLRDTVVEANILGENSVEKMIKGRHYNNATRVLKYIFDAIKRHSIESYEEWLKESSVATEHCYTDHYFTILTLLYRSLILRPTNIVNIP